MSLAIPGRFWVILAESPVKRRDRRCVFYEMIDFPIRKRHFLVWWSVGGPWEPPGRKKDETKCSYKFHILFFSRLREALQKRPRLLGRRGDTRKRKNQPQQNPACRSATSCSVGIGPCGTSSQICDQAVTGTSLPAYEKC